MSSAVEKLLQVPPVEGQARADWRAACLTAGRYDLMVEDYVLPLTVFLPGRPAMSASARTLWGFFQSFHSAMVAAGYTRLVGRVTAEDLPRSARRRQWTDWYGEAPGAAPVLIAQTVCYSRTGGADSRTEMVEFTRLDLPLAAA